MAATQDRPGEELWLQGFLRSFSCPELAQDLYHLLETVRITRFLELELPGLMRRKREMTASWTPGSAVGGRGWDHGNSSRDLLLHEEEGKTSIWPVGTAGLPALVGPPPAGAVRS